MRRYRRIEITAFRRLVVISSGDPAENPGNADSQEAIKTAATEARKTLDEPVPEKEKDILIDAIRLLEHRITNKRTKRPLD